MDGVLLFNKPILWTSHDAVDFFRRRLGERRIGHAGTLDPMATGLLVLLVGKATRLSGSLSSLDKDYYGSLTLGLTTDTQDLEGRITSVSDGGPVRQEDVREAFGAFCGAQLQAPPAFSAAKKAGKKMYEWARSGVTVEAEPRRVEIAQFRLLGFSFPEAYFFISCSKGTYVRTLCEAVGRKLGTGAVMSALVRTRVGNFRLANALSARDAASLGAGELARRLIR
ncbi:MAG: tRNA pseudouridine(55) synthase TruB [Candidatus Omnitrophica bacterium]|nr:tRNA pseudouridine(55) synthase TruB [Candidatus Omnitrophota bacterium]